MNQLNIENKLPIYKQISEMIIKDIIENRISENQRLPSIRSVSKELKVNTLTVQKAYKDIERKGYIYSIKGKGYFSYDKNHIKKIRETTVKEKLDNLFREMIGLNIKKDEIDKTISSFYTQNRKE
ncbi:GntR family transcriptional regulator [Priestia megaterium]|uniref:GntR family transcriptional regulator n=1 Tax=Priestia megaterium TaxID=1404 RepID=UPI00263B7FA7|nr:GntR family transcriptional regulator [Priestia megaterium]MDN4865848.1 GntR family transcriptional regulator [Priestia megaterium]